MSSSSSSSSSSGNGNTASSIYLQVQDADDKYVVFPLDDLPEDSVMVTDPLITERAGLDLWQLLMVEYYKRGRISQFETMLDTILSDDSVEFYSKQQTNMSKLAALKSAKTYRALLAALRSKGDATRAFGDINLQITEVMEMDSSSREGWVLKGLLSLALYATSSDKGQSSSEFLTNAEQAFETSQRVGDQGNIPGLLGSALCMMYQKQYKKALARYASVLYLNPSLSLPVCFGMGVCYFRMKNITKARECFQRVLQLEPTSASGLLGLAVIELNDQKMDKAFGMLRKVYELDASNPMVLCAFANYCFHRGELDQAKQLASQALQVQGKEHRTIKAVANLIIARVFHTNKDFKNASTYYEQSVAQDADNLQAQFGLAQVALHYNRLAKARKCLELVYEAKQHKANFDVLRLLGSVCHRQHDLEKGYQLLKAASELSPMDLEVLTDLAQVCEVHRPEESYAAYQRVIKLMRQHKLPVSVPLWNNYGVVCFGLGKFDEANFALRKAHTNLEVVERCHAERNAEFTDVQVQAVDATATFNYAMLQYAQNNVEVADALHVKILEVFPEYVNSFLARAEVAMQAGELNHARTLIDAALSVDGQDKNALCLSASWEVSSGNLSGAQLLYKQILNSSGANSNDKDSYCKLMQGLICMMKAEQQTNSKRRLDILAKAGTWFQSVLSKQTRNKYAALGMGVVLAKMGGFRQAKDVFLKIRDSDPDILEVWVNLGHVFMKEEAYEQAINIYKRTIEKFCKTDMKATLMLQKYLAYAYYQARAYEKCRLEILKVLHLDPTDDELWYNLAMSQEHFGIEVLQKSVTERTFKEVNLAVYGLQRAAEILKRLVGSMRPGEQASSAKAELQNKAQKHLAFIQEALDAAPEHREDARRREEELKELQQETRRRVAEQEEALRAKEAAEEAERQRKRQEQQAIALEKKRTLETLKAEHERFSKIDRDARRGAEDEEDYDERAEADARKKRRKREKKARQAKLAIEEGGHVTHDGVERVAEEAEEDEPEEAKELRRRQDERVNPAMAKLLDKRRAKQQQREEHGDEEEEEAEEQEASDPESSSSSKRVKKKKKKSRLKRKALSGSESDGNQEDNDNAASGGDDAAVATSSSSRKKRRKLLDEEDDE